MMIKALFVTWMFAGVPQAATDTDSPAEGKSQAVNFVEDLRFGGGEENDLLLWTGNKTSLAVDTRGHMYVVDIDANRILEFNPSGTFVRIIGGKGEGPGEFTTLSNFQILANGKAVAFEVAPGVLPKTTFFDTNINYLSKNRVTSLGHIPVSANFSPLGNLIAGSYISLGESGVMTTVSGILDSEFNSLKELTKSKQNLDQSRMLDPAYLTGVIADLVKDQHVGTAVMGFDSHGNLYTAVSSRYLVTKWNPKLEKQMEFSRDYKPVPLDDETRELMAEEAADVWRVGPMAELIDRSFVRRLIAKLDLKPVKNPVNGILVTQEGKVLVVHKLNRITGDQVADVFNPEGKYEGSVAMKNWAFVDVSGRQRMTFQDGFAYTIETNEEDVNQVVRYRYR